MTLHELFSRIDPYVMHQVTLEDRHNSAYNLFIRFEDPDVNDMTTFELFKDCEVLYWYVTHDGRIVVYLDIERF